MRAINKFPLILLIAGLLAHEAMAQDQIGVASAVNQNTTDLTLEQERKLIDAGYEIIQNHTIETDGIGRAQMLLLDGTAFSVGPNSSVVLDKFIYNPETAEGSLEVTARGLLRIVGGKVTKKQPALIRTNSATVGIRGGIGIVQTNGPQTIATFLYGDEMTVTPNCVDLDTFGDLCSNDFITTVTEPGFSVSVEDEDSEPSEPVEVTEESLDAIQEELEAPEEESATEETTTEETQEEEATTTEETSSDESTTEETASEETTTESTETETEVATDDAGDSTDIEVDEGLLDSSGVSDVSSDVAPDELGTAEEFEVAIELETVEADDANENPAEEVAEETSEAAETSIQDTVSNTQGETAIETATFEVSFNQATLEVEENTSDVTIGVLELDNPYDSPFTVSIEGEGSNQFSFNEETNTLTFTGSSDYETQSNYSLNLKITRATGDILIPLTFSVTDINEPSVISINLSQESFSEDLQSGSIIAESSVVDPENDTISYTLTGTGSENFSVSSDGQITLISSLDYESTTSYNLTLTASDGTHETTSEIAFSVTDVYEPIELSTTLAETSFSEDIATGTTIVTATATDPEGDVITYSLSGTGSENFSISSDGTVTLANTLDYETSSSYTITLTATDGTHSVDSNLTITVSDVNETITLSSSLASGSFAENTASGTTIATSTATDPEGETITYSLSGTGSDNFSISNDGTITLASSLDYETLTSYNLVLSASDGTNTETTDLVFSVSNVEEAVTLSTTLASSSFAEDISAGTLIVNTTAADPDGNEITYTLTGTGSDHFSISNDGSITLLNSLDYESQTSYSLTLTASDGSTSASSDFTFSVTDIEEIIDLSTSMAASSFAEDTATGTTIATASATNTGSDAITFSLSGTGSENFSVSSDGTVTLNSALDFESTTSYNLTLTASDGSNTATNNLVFSVSNINEAATLSTSVASSSFAENISTGTTIATASATDPENATISYSLSGTGSDKFSVSSNGTVTLSSGLDYESTTSYSLTLTASDGTNSTSESIAFSVGDVNEAVSLSTSVASSSFAENISTGTTIATASATDPENATISYSLSGTGSDKFSVSSDGTVTLSSGLDYESTTSYSLTLTASDGTYSATSSFTVSVTNVDLSLSSSLASTSQDENISTGTSIATSSSSNAEGTVSYSLTDADNKFAINSSTGAVTLANAIDYETKTSHQFTITATDGVTTTSQTFTLTVGDVSDGIDSLSVTVANSGAAIGEYSAIGTAVASSSLNNPNSISITYSLSGTDSSNFKVDSSGNITVAKPLNFRDRSSYSLTLTAVGDGATVTDNFTVNLSNVEEKGSEVILMRYSQAYNSASRTGFSATATRGPSGSSLPAYVIEQVGNIGAATPEDQYGFNNQDDGSGSSYSHSTGNTYVGTIIDGGNRTNWKYFFPFCHESNSCSGSSVGDVGEHLFVPNMTLNGISDAEYQSVVGTTVTTDITNVISAARNSVGWTSYWFMLTEQSAADISYTSKNNGKMWYTSAASSNYTNWGTEAGNLSTPLLTDLFVTDYGGDDFSHIDFSMYALVVYPAIGNYSCSGLGACQHLTSNYARFQTYLTTPDSLLVLHGENQSWDDQNDALVVFLESIMSGSDFSWQTGGTEEAFDTSVLGESIASNYPAWQSYSGSTLICDSDFDDYCYTTFAIFPASMTDSQYVGDVIVWMDSDQMSNSTADTDILELAASRSQTTITSTYSLYEDQAIVAGQVYEYQEDFINGLCVGATCQNNVTYVIAFAPLAIENYATNAGTANDYFYPNFIPTNLWSYGDVGLDYCIGMGNTAAECDADYTLNYEWNSKVRDNYNNAVWTDTKIGVYSSNTFPEGMSMWWQIFRSTGGEDRLVGPGLWAQLSFKDSYDGAEGSTTRDDQESLLNVVISQVHDRQFNTTKYSSGDTGSYMDGYHYWSYQGATNADNNGLGINYGISPIECVTHPEGGCFFGDDNNFPNALMITTSDPYKSGDMTLGVNYNSNTDTFSTGTFNQPLFRQHVKISTSYWEDAAQITNFRCGSCSGDGSANNSNSNLSAGYDVTATSLNGYFAGILEFDVSGTGNNQLAPIRSSSTLATFSFDTTNHDVQVVAPMTISAAPSNNYTSNWTTVDTGSITLKFGDATNDEAKSAMISREVFAAEIQDDGSQIDGSSGGSNNLAGVLVSYNTIEKEDSDLFHANGNNPMPNTAYSTWGFWAMSAVDISPNSGSQNASVHMGTWVAGTSPSTSEIPTSGTASMSGAAVMKVAYRYNQTGTNYDIHKYTTTADVAATFNWGASGYSGSLAFTNFDDKNPIVDNAGFASFTIAIAGTSGNSLSYSGDSTDAIDNSWSGGASAVGYLFGEGGIDESGGRVNVSLFKSGDTGTAGANDFYFAEGIYLVD